MAGYNRVIFMGNLTRDPETKQLTSGQSVCRLSLASNRQFKNRQSGQLVQEVCFIDVDVWGAQADSCQQYLQKGRSVLIEGRLKLDSWQDNEGQKRSKHSLVADRVVFLASSNQVETSGKEDEDISASFQAEKSTETPSFKAASGEVEKKGRKKHQEAESSGDWENSGEVNFKDQKPFEDDLPF